jgi:hypothetical protein
MYQTARRTSAAVLSGMAFENCARFIGRPPGPFRKLSHILVFVLAQNAEVIV